MTSMLVVLLVDVILTPGKEGVAIGPDGETMTLTVMIPAKPFDGPRVTVELWLSWPTNIVRVEIFDPIVKSTM